MPQPQPRPIAASYWQVQCVCGLEIKTSARTFQCPNCGREEEIQTADYHSKPPEPTVTGKMEAEDGKKGLTGA
jgi:predicted RNA-binding Zn-ribbon protein involved in translation (DUF1610 family)